MPLGLDGASKEKTGQAIMLASAAAKTSMLEHDVWSTFPSTMTVSGGQHHVPHMDPKSQTDQYIRDKLLDLAKNTSFL